MTLFDDAKEITISDEIGGVFSVGEFENERHKVSMSMTFPGSVDIPEKQRQLYGLLSQMLSEREKKSHQKFIEKTYSFIRWYDIDGQKYPSVTSVLNAINPMKFHVDSEKLKGYAARGNVGDLVLQEFIKTKKWLEPHKIPEAHRWLQIMETHQIDYAGDIQGFCEKYQVNFLGGHETVVSNKYKYAGQLDATCKMMGSDIFTVADLKMADPDKKAVTRYLKQCAAYLMALAEMGKCGLPAQIAIFPVHGGTKQGFSKPVVTDNIESYFKMFLSDREAFKEMFGV